MPTVLRDSKELIQVLESLKITPDCLLVTADVKSLYSNINIKKASSWIRNTVFDSAR